MNLEKDSFIKHFSENRNKYNDPKMKQEYGIITLVNNGFNKMNLIGNLFIVILVPVIITILITTKQLPTSTNSFLIRIAIVWFIITLYKRIQKIIANNNVIFDVDNRFVTIEPQDHFRRNIMKIKKRNYSFNSIRSIETKTRNYDKFNSGLRLVLTHRNEEITLVDIWTKKLGTDLNQFVRKLVTEK
ncbi:hypothetical protein LNJ08_12435 [Tenacibaculum finnmarkense genomovar ulcerans]|uniref:hypothetical protein n=1 Tax=Tenacibaculum finnmarkense TaxID=2781243 RepID=UPI001E2FB2BB|nr:hypothetical protein [Tenacibaculum finnmarkense]MCD8455198.1 hypothetical protein [Tenacibaculum finnmarkense genomovar ulcerans]